MYHVAIALPIPLLAPVIRTLFSVKYGISLGPSVETGFLAAVADASLGGSEDI